MKIYTGRGDRGRTSLFSGERVEKSDPRVEAYGTLDELNSTLGLARSFTHDPSLDETLRALQDQLFRAGADLATRPDSSRSVPRIEESDWRRLEEWIDRFQEGLPELDRFILPSGSPAGASLHLARTLCRRAERRVVALGECVPETNPALVVYLNRLSDLLFVLARVANQGEGEEEFWQSER